MNYKIISTGSKGNAVVIDDIILIDCGVAFKALYEVFRQLKLVMLTHIHGDHFNRSTLRMLALERPTLRFACCSWLVSDLVSCQIPKKQIDVLELDSWYDYGVFKVSPVGLYHNVPNCGYRIIKDNKKLIYATDTGTMDKISAVNYDLYMIECNHTREEIEERVRQKRENNLYCYEYKAAENHLSKEQADDFIYSNIGVNGEYVYLHQHE